MDADVPRPLRHVHSRRSTIMRMPFLAVMTVLLTRPLAAQQAAPKLDDATIVAIFDQANTADIEMGELAVRQGSSARVRDFGAMLARDHGAVRQMGRDLAKKLGVTPTP